MRPSRSQWDDSIDFMKVFLVLEDEPLVAMDLRFAFEDSGHEAIVVANNREALEAIEGSAIAAAILDVSLGGGETCEPTAAKLSDEAIPFLLHTGDWNRAGERLRKFDAPVLTKPQNSETVVARAVALTE